MLSGITPIRPTDVIVQVVEENGGRWVWPPVVVVTKALPVSGTRAIHIVRGRVDLEPRPADEVEQGLRSAGLRGGSTWPAGCGGRSCGTSSWPCGT